LKLLSKDQISLAKKPNKPGRKKTNSSENYQNIYNRTSNALALLQQVSELLPDLEKNASFNYSKETYNYYFTKILPIIEKTFPIKESGGIPYDDTILFDESKINSQSIKLATRIIKISSDYLLQAFPSNEYEYLHPRLENMIKEIDNLIKTFDRNRKLQKQIALYEHQIIHFEPISMGEYESKYNVGCLYCRQTSMGKTAEEAIINISHMPECRSDKLSKNSSISTVERWYKIIPPKRLLITWEDRKKLDKSRET